MDRAKCSEAEAREHISALDQGKKFCIVCKSYKDRVCFKKYAKGVSVPCDDCFTDYHKTLYERKKAHWFKRRLKGIQARAKKLNLPFDITEDYIENLYGTQRGRCAISGLVMDQSKNRKGIAKLGPRSASLDRIDPKLGYVKGNVRWILWCLNVALMNWGEKEFLDIARACVKKGQ
jgi:hypothetical protein